MEDNEQLELAKRQLAVRRGRELRSLRERRGWTQVQLAERASTSQQTIDRLERGDVLESRALGRVLEALGAAPDLVGRLATSSEGLEVAPSYRLNKSAEVLDVELRHRRLEREPALIPVYLEDAWISGGEPNSVDAISRPFPLERTLDGYGVILSSYDLSPAYGAGDTVLVHPFLPPRPGDDVLYRSEEGRIALRHLRRVDGDSHVVARWTPEAEETFSRQAWPVRHVIVGKFSRL